MNKKIFRVHPIMIPFFLLFYLSGEIAVYSIVFGSLLFHEVGHLAAAKLIGVKVNSCTIFPYGGVISIEQFSKRKKKHQLLIILSGPLFTFLLFIMISFIDFPQKNLVLMTQIIILSLNLLPIYPLDGGRALFIFIPNKYVELIGFSICFSFIILCVSLYYYPKSLSITIIFLFLVIQNYSNWRFRKYKLAYEYITRST